MEIVSQRNFVPMPARKVRLVAMQVKRIGDPEEALHVLAALPKAAAEPIYKTIKTALADARNTFGRTGPVRIKNIIINDGMRLKRFRPVSRGTAHPVVKRTSHIRVVLEVD